MTLLPCDPSVLLMGVSLGRRVWQLMSDGDAETEMVQWFNWVGGVEKRILESWVCSLFFCHKHSLYVEHCLHVSSERVKI